MTLKTLEQHEKERTIARDSLNPRSHPNGIACPKCGKEMIDEDCNIVLLCDPPRLSIHCESCGWHGSRML